MKSFLQNNPFYLSSAVVYLFCYHFLESQHTTYFEAAGPLCQVTLYVFSTRL